MIPQVQSRIGKHGRCLNASIASILGIPEAAVPDFPDATYRKAVDDFLRPFGKKYEQFPISAPSPKGWHLIEGVSPRGGMHAVVGYNGKFKHDPHPIEDDPRRGLVKPMRWGVLKPINEELAPVGDPATQMERLRSRAMKTGPFTVQLTEPDGREHTESVRKLRAYDAVSKKTLEKRVEQAKARYETARGRVGMAEERRKYKGHRLQSTAEVKARSRQNEARSEVYRAEQALKDFGQITDTSAATIASLFAALWAWYEVQHQEPEPTYDLTKYRPKRKTFDSTARPRKERV